MRAVVYRVWEDDSIVVIPIPDRRNCMPGKTFLYSLEGPDWNDIMRQHHGRQGWESYVPMKD